MIAAILRAQLLSMRITRRGGRAGRVFSAFTALIFYGFFAFMAWGAMLYFSSPDMAAYFLPALSSGMMFAMLYWQLAPIISASFGASLDLRKLLSYPIPHSTLFTAEVLLRIATCAEMLILIGGVVCGLLRNPLFGWHSSPLIFAGALFFCATNILLSAGTRNLLERLFLRTRVREVMLVAVIFVSIAPQILLAMKVRASTFAQLAPSRFIWPWSAPAHAMLGQMTGIASVTMLVWFGAAWAFSRWQFQRSIRYDETRFREPVRESRKGLTLADRAIAFPSRFLKDPIAALVEKELRTLTRIPRFRVVYFMSSFFGLVMYVPTMMRNRAPSTFMLQAGLPIMCLYGLLMLGQISFWNSLGFDRSAVQAYFSWPVSFRSVLIAKNICVICFIVPQTLFVSAAIRLIHVPAGPLKVLEAVIVILIASLYWLGMGNICSVRMPRALDPSRMNQMSNKLQAVTVLGAPFLLVLLVLAYWSRWFFESELLFAGIVLLSAIVGGIVYWVSLDTAVQMASRRREQIITQLSSTEGPLSTT